MTAPSGVGEVILASASQSRAALLRQVGLDFKIMAADVDEESIKGVMLADKTPHAQIAAALADIKASQISKQHPDALVIGADQILSAKEVLYSKPANLAEARAQLKALSGRPHELITAVTLARGGHIIWRHSETARLRMRDLSDEFIDNYLAKMGKAVTATVGCYQLEGYGPLLFDDISGDYYAILGLPLLPLLNILRDHRVIAS